MPLNTAPYITLSREDVTRFGNGNHAEGIRILELIVEWLKEAESAKAQNVQHTVKS